MTPAASAGHFEAKYRDDEDPWGYRTRWYERRKYAITLASLPRERYRTAWEPACSIGVLTRQLAGRAGRVHASDVSPTAIEAARREPVPAGVTFAVERLPGPAPVPPGGADLVVLSEILYYLPEADRAAVLAAAHEALEPGGDLVVVHWRPQPEDADASGDEVNARLRTLPDWRPVLRHEDEGFVLDVLRRP